VNSLSAGRWLLPWLGTLLASGAVAYAADEGLRRGVISGSAPVEQSAIGSKWVVLSSVNADGAGRRFACLTGPGVFAADVLQLQAADLDRIVSELQCYPLATGADPPTPG
jgi:hypothetical protein